MKTRFILIISVTLAILIMMTMISGCSFRVFEGFEDGNTAELKKEEKEEASEPVKKQPLTPMEKEMFENIRKGNITDQDIQKFISEGKLTEKMVEKFLENLDAMPLPGAKTTTTPPAKPARAPEEGFDIEGFTGSQFATY